MSLQAVRDAFFRIGWLLPVLGPLTQVGGRALFNILLLVYLVWGLLAVPGRRVEIPKAALLLWGALLAGYGLSIVSAVDANSAFHEWVKFALHSTVFYFMLVVLQEQPEKVSELARALGLMGLCLIVLLFIKLFWQMGEADFLPTSHMKEDNLPFIMPFVLYFLMTVGKVQLRKWLTMTVLLVALSYIALSQGRAALLALLVMLFFYGLWILRWRLSVMLGAISALLLLAVALSYDTFFRIKNESGWVEILDRFTSYRTRLWRQALENPPDNLLLGVGMANASAYADVVRVNVHEKVSHLHNFLFDAWYETGIVGLVVMLGFIAIPLLLAWRARSGAETGENSRRALMALFMVSAFAILTAGLLSFSYASRQFAFYLPVMLAVLWVLSGRQRLQSS